MEPNNPLTLCSKQAIYITVYVVFGASHAILIKATSGSERTLPYNPVSVTLAIEFCKLIGACIMYFTWADNQSFDEKLKALKAKSEIGVRYSVPAALYCVYNALMFYAIALVGPGTYRVLINVKVLMAGVMLSALGLKTLSGRQWGGLVLLVCACGVEQWGSFDWDIGPDALLMVGIMAFCSAAAGVSNQMLLQTRQTAVLEHGGRHVWQNNIFMYTWSSLINTVYLYITAPDALTFDSFAAFTPTVYAIIGFSCFLGFATAFLLAEASVIVKEYANFFDMLLTVFVSWAWLGIPVKSTLMAAVGLLTISLYLYNVPAVSAPVDPAGGGTPLTTILVGGGGSSKQQLDAAAANAQDRAPLLVSGDAAPAPAAGPDPARP